MGFLRNSQIRRELWIFGGISAGAFLCGLAHSLFCGLLVLALACGLASAHFIATYRRYRDIAALSRNIDAVLHGNRDIRFESYAEGELSVLENELQKMTLRLRETAEALGKEKLFLQDSIADISHQLRTPLTSINLVLSMLSGEALRDGQREELCRELRGLIGRMDWLVETLLKISKIDAGSVQFRKERVTVSGLIRKAVQPLEVALDIRQQKIEAILGDTVVTVDPGWTAEAVSNILKNCMEHTPGGGTISVRAGSSPFFTELRISDTGGGIPEKDLPHLFERFYKGSNASEESIGIGLSLCYSIITAQGGTVTAENSANGAVFTIRFPKGL